jgi:FecCD transport family
MRSAPVGCRPTLDAARGDGIPEALLGLDTGPHNATGYVITLGNPSNSRSVDIARMLAGPNFARLLPVAMLLGAAFLLAVDTLARTLARVETPIGILTAVVGAPFFLWLLVRGRRSWG